MRPAWSIIFFTTMSGLGLGLAGWIVIGLLPLMTQQAVIGVGVVTLALIGAGLISSTFISAIRSGPGARSASGGRAGCRVKACWR